MKNQLILLHGALGNKSRFQNLSELLSPHFEVHSLDFPGHGRNASNQKFSMEIFAKEVVAFMDKNALKSAAVFGYSMGGYVGLKMAMDFPERVEKVITLATKVYWNEKIAAKELQMLDTEKMQVKVPKFVEKLKYENPVSDWKELVNKTANMLFGLGNGKAFSASEFAKIEVPVLVLRGSEDKMVTRVESEDLAQNLQNGTYMEIPGGLHPLEKVDALKLKEIITKFAN